MYNVMLAQKRSNQFHCLKKLTRMRKRWGKKFSKNTFQFISEFRSSNPFLNELMTTDKSFNGTA